VPLSPTLRFGNRSSVSEMEQMTPLHAGSRALEAALICAGAVWRSSYSLGERNNPADNAANQAHWNSLRRQRRGRQRGDGLTRRLLNGSADSRRCRCARSNESTFHGSFTQIALHGCSRGSVLDIHCGARIHLGAHARAHTQMSQSQNNMQPDATVMGSSKSTSDGVCDGTAGVLFQVHVVNRHVGRRGHALLDVGLLGC